MKERIATEGMWLTQAILSNENERLFVKKVCGFGDLNTLYTEWTDEHKEQWEDEHPQEENEDISAEEALGIIINGE